MSVERLVVGFVERVVVNMKGVSVALILYIDKAYCIKSKTVFYFQSYTDFIGILV